MTEPPTHPDLPPGQLTETYREGGLRRKLMYFAHSLTLLGVVLLAISLVIVLWLRANANELARHRAPAVEAALQLQVGLQRSLASLRGWVSLGDEQFIEERRSAWVGEIYPSLAALQRLQELYPDDDRPFNLGTLRSSLANLKESQWWVEDVAQAEGNDRSRYLAWHFLRPVATAFRRAAQELRSQAATSPRQADRRLAEATSELLDRFLVAEKSLADYVAMADRSARAQFFIDSAKVDQALKDITHPTNPLLLEYVRYIAREWPVYKVIAMEVVDARGAPDANVAVHLMATETVPLTRSVNRLLTNVAERQVALMRENSQFVQDAGAIAIVLSVLLMIIMGFLAYMLADRRATHITQPVVRLSTAARELAAGTLHDDLPITTDDELGNLTAAFNKMRADLQQSQAALNAAHEKMSTELDRAATYVQSTLPRKLDDKEGKFLTDWHYIASSQLGGDLFGYHELDDHRMVMYLLDVSGHGIGSSLLSVSAHDTIRRHTLPNVRFENPPEVLAALNAAFPMEENHGHFFTIWYGVYDSRTRELTFSVAGHHPAIMIEPQSQEAVDLGTRNLMIGVMPDVEFDVGAHLIPPGSRLYIFSDGAFEINGPNDDMLGFDGLRAIISSIDGQTPAARLDQILKQIREFQGTDEFVDDYSMTEITML